MKGDDDLNSAEMNKPAAHSIQLVMYGSSFFVAIYLLMMIPRSIGTGYSLLFLLPLSYIAFLTITIKNQKEIPANIGLTILYIIEYIRLVISPFLVAASGYENIIVLNAEENNVLGIMLLVYETFAISIALLVRIKILRFSCKSIGERRSDIKIRWFVIIFVLLCVIVCYYAPEVIQNYRVITGIFTDNEFSNIEQSYVVNKYATSFIKKLFLVLANYILKIARAFLPIYLIVLVSKKDTVLTRLFSLLLVFSPLLFVDGAIARSLYLTLLFLIVYNNVYRIDIKRMYAPIIISIIFVLIYWMARFKLSGGQNVLAYFSNKSADYFAGVNIIGGSCNLPSDLDSRFHYFTLDLLRSVPFANSLFGLDSRDYVQIFFNNYNMTTGGQIPTTIGMGYYYFSIIFAPAYSVIFAILCKKFGNQAIYQKNHYYKFTYNYLSFLAALGIGMYNIEITLGNMVQVVLPIYLAIRCAYGKEKDKYEYI